ncbi:hypothetical protein HD597_008313 [Nonomuraea thailandensis]|uniref:Uncharacterized protein n=1 Tax=Nonomuraea thailandensis TaxID=1188745 RepID=A0A9X2GUY0_9ACTN|nr:hypothetical protein [Nonomuraea thailandensis]MCP2361293.1 hypothetical protein [Nonomuraea thailandensis]
MTVASCGAQPSAPARYTASMTVLEGGGHGPQLCNVVMESNPPQCEGPDVVGLDWGKVAHESLNGVKWGRYRLVGTWDGTRLTLTEPPGEPVEEPDKGDRFASPCPEPEGGWRPADPARATEQTMKDALARARSAQDYAGSWLDRFTPEPEHPEEQMEMDAHNYVLNLRFTGDLAARESWIREVWGGALCLSGAERTEAELRAVQRDLEDELGKQGAEIISVGADELANLVRVSAWVATDELRQRLEDEHGADVISLEGVLKPVG